MQRQHTDDMKNDALPGTTASNTVDVDDMNMNNNNNHPEGEGEIDLAASLSRIDALAESLASITRKRHAEPNSGHSKRRGSINSSADSSLQSFAGTGDRDRDGGVDDLLNNLEGLEFDIINNPNDNEMSLSRLSLSGHGHGHSHGHYGGGGADSASWNDSVSSRLSSGLWSLQDVEQWSCTTCTYENEPVFLACEMCGQTRPARTPHNMNVREESSGTGEAEAVKIRQEQRLSELRQFHQKPAATTTGTATAPSTGTTTATTSASEAKPAAVNSRRRSKSPLPPSASSLSSSSHARRSRLSLSPKPPSGRRSLGPKAGSRRGAGLAGSSHHSLSLSAHGNSLHGPSLHGPSLHGPGGLSSGENSMSDLFADCSSSLHKPRRFDLQDSAHTAATFNSSFGASESSFDYFPSELMVYPPGIEEEEGSEELHLM